MGDGTPKTQLGRHPERGHYDRAAIDPIVDEAIYCHLGIVREGIPVVLPTIHVRVGDALYVHGAAQSRLLVDGEAQTVCVTITLLDGLVVARSAFHHSLNFRSVVVYGPATKVEDDDEKRRVLDALVDHVVPGRVGECRAPSDDEIRATTILRIPLDTASAKIRTGPVADAPKDLALDHWAGILPMRLVAGAPEPDAALAAEHPIPEYLLHYERPGQA